MPCGGRMGGGMGKFWILTAQHEGTAATEESGTTATVLGGIGEAHPFPTDVIDIASIILQHAR